MSGWVTTMVVAAELGVRPETIRRWAQEGRLPYLRAGGRYRFNIQQVVESLKVRRADAVSKVEDKPCGRQEAES